MKSLLYPIVITILVAGCSITGGEDEENHLPPEGTPTQFHIEEGPQIEFGYAPNSPWILFHEPALKFSVVTGDSIPHLNWLPTKLTVETDQGYRSEIILAPYACIVPIENAAEDYPFNVEWWSCNTININNGILLSDEQIQEIESVTDSRLTVTLQFKTMSGGQYLFDLNDVGRPAIQQAIDQIEQQSYIQSAEGENAEYYGVSHAPQYPRCWLSDVIPPPPCPPWSLYRIVRLSQDGEKAGYIPVQQGGWVKATYELPDSTEKSTTFTVPEWDE